MSDSDTSQMIQDRADWRHLATADLDGPWALAVSGLVVRAVHAHDWELLQEMRRVVRRINARLVLMDDNEPFASGRLSRLPMVMRVEIVHASLDAALALAPEDVETAEAMELRERVLLTLGPDLPLTASLLPDLVHAPQAEVEDLLAGLAGHGLVELQLRRGVERWALTPAGVTARCAASGDLQA